MKPKHLIGKLSRPRLFDALARDRLFLVLDKAWERAGLWLTAPAGAGKTTLLASYLERRRLKHLWYQIDEGDADAATFFMRMSEAGGQFAQDEQEPLPLLTAEYQHDVRAFARRFWGEMFRRLPPRTVVVLDNYQVLAEDCAVHDAICEALGEVPIGILVVAISREDPPGRFARRRANQQLARLTWDDIRLTESETANIARLKGCHESDTHLRLHRLCDGWAAGLILLLEHAPSPDDNPSTSEGTRQAVFDYFAGEVLDRISAELRRVLFETALLPRFTPSMAVLLTCNPEAESLLEDVYRRRLFVDRRAGDEPVYEFHALFRDFLTERLEKASDLQSLRELAIRAGALLTAAGHHDDAFALYCRYEHWNEAVRLLLSHARMLLGQGRNVTLRDWANRLPQETRSDNPWVAYWVGQSWVQQNRQEACKVLETAHDVFERMGDWKGVLLCASAIVASYHFDWTDFRGLDRWIPVLEQAVLEDGSQLTADDELDACAGLLSALIFRKARSGDLAAVAARTLQLLERPGNANRRMAAATQLISYCYLAGVPEIVERVCGIVTSMRDEPGITPHAWAFWHGRYALLLWRMHRLPECAEANQASSRLCEAHGFDELMSWCHFGRMYLEAREMDVPGMQRTASRLRAGLKHGRVQDLYFASICDAALSLYRRQFGQAVQFCRQAVVLADGAGGARIVAAARAWLASALAHAGEYDEAESVMRQGRDLLCGTPFSALQSQFTLIEVFLCLRRGDRDRAWAVMLPFLRNPGAVSDLSEFILHGRQLMTVVFQEALRSALHGDSIREVIRHLNLVAEDYDCDEWPWRIRLFTLGRFDVVIEGAPPPTRGKSPVRLLELLQRLIVAGRDGQHVTHLAEQVWPDLDGDTAERNLDVAVSRLRKYLGVPGAITLQDQRVALNPRCCWVDAWAFQDLARQAVRGAGADAVEKLRAAFALFKGQFLAKVAEQPWFLEHRDTLRNQWRRLVERLCEAMAAGGEQESLIELLTTALDCDPVAERLYRRLMQAQLGLGDRAGAMDTFHRCQQSLFVHLRVFPSVETQALMASAVKQISKGSDSHLIGAGP